MDAEARGLYPLLRKVENNIHMVAELKPFILINTR
jgi:hypothetical protein